VEASAIQHPAGLSRLPLALPLLRLRSDEQLVALFRAGHDDAFGVLHDRYRARLFAYVRQMLSSLSRQDAEDVLQDVFVRAYGALRADAREMNVRAWLYRVAHNRCIDHLRRPVPPAAEIYEVSRGPAVDPTEQAQQREDLARLVDDIARLPDQQRSALLMRELDGMSYADLAHALDVTVPAVKSLLVRARVGLVDAAEARDADCAEIRADLVDAYDRGVKASGRTRRHLRTCSGCTDYRAALRGMRRSFAALSPVGFGPLAFAHLLGAGGAGSGAAAGGTAAVSGSAAVGGTAAAGSGGALMAGGTIATTTACKVAAVVCTAAIATGGAVEVQHIAAPHPAPKAAATAPAPPLRTSAIVPAPPLQSSARLHGRAGALGVPPVRSDAVRDRPAGAHHPVPAALPGTAVEPGAAQGDGTPAVTPYSSGGAQAPDAVATDPGVAVGDAPAAGDGTAGALPDGASAGGDNGSAADAGAAGASAPAGVTTAPGSGEPAAPPQR
jgi:RNA polymerase sigma factor (sigma-70 family)